MEELRQTTFEGWALVEIMGHRRAAGLVTTEYIGTAAFLRIVTPDVPATRMTLEKDAWLDGSRVYSGSVVEISRPRTEILVGSGSIYAITPIDEADILSHAPLTQTVIERAERKVIDAPTYDEQREDDDTDDSDRYEP